MGLSLIKGKNIRFENEMHFRSNYWVAIYENGSSQLVTITTIDCKERRPYNHVYNLWMISYRDKPNIYDL